MQYLVINAANIVAIAFLLYCISYHYGAKVMQYLIKPKTTNQNLANSCCTKTCVTRDFLPTNFKGAFVAVAILLLSGCASQGHDRTVVGSVPDEPKIDHATNIPQADPDNEAPNEINIDIGHNFDWETGNIKRLAVKMSEIYHERCLRSCVIKLRIHVDKAVNAGVGKRIEWLKHSLASEMKNRSGKDVGIIDTIHIV